MSQAPKLHVIPEPDHKVKARKESLDHLKEAFDDVKKTLEENSEAGWVVITYCRQGSEGAYISGDYHLNDPMDAYWLPDMVKDKIKDIRKNGN